MRKLFAFSLLFIFFLVVYVRAFGKKYSNISPIQKVDLGIDASVINSTPKFQKDETKEEKYLVIRQQFISLDCFVQLLPQMSPIDMLDTIGDYFVMFHTIVHVNLVISNHITLIFMKHFNSHIVPKAPW